MKRLFLILSFVLGFSLFSTAQKQVRKDIRAGNKEYKQQKYTDAEVDFRRALEANARSTEAAYNLGNTLYRQEKGQEALEQYKIVLGNETDKTKLAMAWHNIGNMFMNGKDYRNSIDAYKQALRNNPQDDETRYNLALAQKLLQDQQNQDQNQDQNQQDQDQKQDQQQQEQKQDQQDQKQDQQQQQPNPNEMSKENADQILDAMMQEEKDTQEKVKAQQMQQQKQRKTEKNW